MSGPADLRLGVDVGGTNTDAVVLDAEGRLLAEAKTPTTPDVMSGVVEAVRRVVEAIGGDTARITHAMLGTTHVTNAVLQRRGLVKVAVLRVGAPATLAVPPLSQWPSDLRDAVVADVAVIRGGIEFNGDELAPLDEAAAETFVNGLDAEVHTVAVTCVFASVSDRHETAVLELCQRVRPDLEVVLSSRFGSVGLLERENATVLNAALTELARQVTDGFRSALGQLAIAAVCYFTQNDGTLMALDEVTRYPVLTIGSGPANSIRGAAYLTGLQDALVVDVGGTSTDVGVLVNGFPRESAQPTDIGGIRTNFRMPDVLSVAIGGGTCLSLGAGRTRVGPASVGYHLESEALVFGGDQPTLTDAAVAARRADLGTVSHLVRHAELLETALPIADAQLADSVDRMKTSSSPEPLVVVGGASFLVPDDLPGAGAVIRPLHYEVANAVGAAIAPVSGSIDRLFTLGPGGRDAAVQEAKDLAVEEAIRLGADPQATEVVEVEEIAASYMASPVLRVRAKAAGSLATV